MFFAYLDKDSNIDEFYDLPEIPGVGTALPGGETLPPDGELILDDQFSRAAVRINKLLNINLRPNLLDLPSYVIYE